MEKYHHMGMSINKHHRFTIWECYARNAYFGFNAYAKDLKNVDIVLKEDLLSAFRIEEIVTAMFDSLGDD